MAIINPTPTDFINNQERALDYQQYRSSSDVLRAVAEFYKVSVFKDTTEGVINFITTGLKTVAMVDSDKIKITVTEGAAVIDNQPIIFLNDFLFEYDKPASDTTYYIYLSYKYVEEYPPNYAFIEIFTSEANEENYFLLSRVAYDSDNDTVTVDMSPRDSLTNDAIQESNSGKLFPIYINNDSVVQTGNLYFVDTSAGPVTLTIEDEPNNNDLIAFYDVRGTFNINPLTVQAPTGYTVQFQNSLVFNNKFTYAVFQILDPSSDTNWYKLYDVAEVYDSGEY